MDTLTGKLMAKLEIKETDSKRVQYAKAFGKGTLDGAVIVGSVAVICGYIDIGRKLNKKLRGGRAE